MATRYPHVSILGIDLSPTPLDPSLLPPNLSFEIDDVNEGLKHYHGQFEVIQMRSVMAGINDIDETVQDVMLCLKPGGLLIMICADTTVYSEDRITAAKIPDTRLQGAGSEGSWFSKILRGAYLLLYPCLSIRYL
jgi:trans-aconitate methyltransferase